MNLLESLLAHEGDSARSRLRELVTGAEPQVRTADFNTYEAEADREAREVRVWDVFDGSREPDLFTFDQVLARLK